MLAEDIREITSIPEKMIFTVQEQKQYEKETECWICNEKFGKNDKVRDHCHFTGRCYLNYKLEALERLYRSTGLIFLQWQKKFLTIIIQSLHFSSLKKKGMEKTCEKRRKK